ncbi:MAG TPA: hypothetical protein VFV67_01265 [Actinophytocola sp.]|nr:hypothetical protein [Actinophytocola sp.]HEU5469253.1 hypothetical protein [Actinophytocola sp.]
MFATIGDDIDGPQSDRETPVPLTLPRTPAGCLGRHSGGPR